MGDTAVIFPGQGSQVVGMGQDVAQAYPRAQQVFERANDVLGFDIAKLCFAGPAEELEKTDIQQPAIFVTSVAMWEAFLEAGGQRDQFSRTGGLSLGEYTALYVAGAVGFDEALKLVHRRGRLMQEASTASASGMVSLIGADEVTAERLCDDVRAGDVLVPANFNCPGQIVISGSKAACSRAVEVANRFGCRAVALPVAGAFHSPFMEPAATGLWPTLEAVEFCSSTIPVVSNVDAEYHQDPEKIRVALRQQIVQPVLWQRCVERMIQDGVNRFVEIGPGRVLTGLMRKISRKMPAVNVSTRDSIAGALPTAAATSMGGTE